MQLALLHRGLRQRKIGSTDVRLFFGGFLGISCLVLGLNGSVQGHMISNPVLPTALKEAQIEAAFPTEGDARADRVEEGIFSAARLKEATRPARPPRDIEVAVIDYTSLIGQQIDEQFFLGAPFGTDRLFGFQFGDFGPLGQEFELSSVREVPEYGGFEPLSVDFAGFAGFGSFGGLGTGFRSGNGSESGSGGSGSGALASLQGALGNFRSLELDSNAFNPFPYYYVYSAGSGQGGSGRSGVVGGGFGWGGGSGGSGGGSGWTGFGHLGLFGSGSGWINWGNLCDYLPCFGNGPFCDWGGPGPWGPGPFGPFFGPFGPNFGAPGFGIFGPILGPFGPFGFPFLHDHCPPHCVPEPSTMVVLVNLALACGVGCGVRRWRRRNGETKTASV